MAPFRCLILEDDALASKLLEQLVRGEEQLELSGVFSSMETTIAYLKNNPPPHLLFLDVELNGRSGLEIMSHLPEGTGVILTTAHTLYAFNGFEIGAIDFLKKPISRERFSKAVNKFLQLQTEKRAPVIITLTSGKQVYRFRRDEILYVESLKDYVRVTTTETNQLFLYTLKQLEELLEPKGFLRISKSCIINLQHFSYLKGTQLCLKNGTCFTTGRTFRQKIKAVLSTFKEGLAP